MKRSAILLPVVLLAITFASPSYGDGDALKHWLKRASRVTVASSYRPRSINVKRISLEHVQEIEQRENIKIAKEANSNMLYIYNGDSPAVLDKKLQTDTNFLPFLEDRATFMHLNHNQFGNWFATSPLSGCDVWIADSKNLEPVVIHINANKFGNQPLRNLEYKQELANNILNHLNRGTGRQKYEFVLRISYDFEHDKDTSRQEKTRINGYWNTFKKSHSNILFVLYKIDKDAGFLYGTHNMRLPKLGRAWKFRLKDLGSGRILESIACTATTKVGCVIQ